MQGAYLVQLGTESGAELAGRVEEVDTGRAFRFRSGSELLRFLEDTMQDQLEQKVAGQEKAQ